LWVRTKGQYIENLSGAINWLSKQCNYGRFGSTHSTILGIKALLAYEDFIGESAKEMTIDVKLGDELITNTFLDENQNTVSIVLDEDKLHPGFNKPMTITVHGNERAKPYLSANILYRNILPDNHPLCCVKLEAALSNMEINEGESTEINVAMVNTDESQGVPMTVALVGLPGGLEPRHKQLGELVSAGKIDYYEVKDRNVVLYLREMGPGQRVEFKVDVIGTIPGIFQGDASSIYLYYTDREKYWVEPLGIKINPQNTR